MNYYGIIRERSKSSKLTVKIIILFMIFIEFFTKKYLYLIITLFLLAASLLSKKHIVSEEGINIQYNWLIKVIDTLWQWADITAVAYDDKKAKPNIYFYFGKGLSTRAFIMKREDFSGLIQLINDIRPDLIINNLADE